MITLYRKLTRSIRILLSVLYLVLVVLTIPLAFDVGGISCGLSYSLTIFLLYFVLTTIRLITRRHRYVRWISVLYYTQHLIIPSLLTFFLSYYNSANPVELMPTAVWRYLIVNSTPIFTILEGFCSLLSIQAIGQTINWFTVYKSDSWLIVSLVGSSATITAAAYFLYRIYVLPFTIDLINASLLGSLLTLTLIIGLYGIISGKGSIIESSLLFAYIVRCIYETFPILSENASQALTALLSQATSSLRNEIPIISPQISHKLLQFVPFLALNLPASFKSLWEFLLMAIEKLPLLLLVSLAYRIGVFYGATKIIPSLYHGASYPLISPARTPPQPASRKSSRTSISEMGISDQADGEKSRNDKNVSKSGFGIKPPHRLPPSAIIRLIYAYSPCLIIAVYTHLMMLYSGELETELKLWGYWDSSQYGSVIVHPLQFWNWINMATTLLLYVAELLGNNNNGESALTSHWKIE